LPFCNKNNSFAQNSDKLLAELSVEGCKCINNIKSAGKSKEEILEAIKTCLEEETNTYHLGKQLMSIEIPTDIEDKDTVVIKSDITFTLDPNSPEYRESYQEVESYQMENCPQLKNLVASNDDANSKSYSKNREALKLYDKGIKYMVAENNKKAAIYFKKAVDIDSEFAFAWDNLGLCYRKLKEYDKAIECYNNSLKVDPNGITPLQNLAIVYQYQKEYELAIETYERLAELDENNPEIYYGIGLIQSVFLENQEEGLKNMCKAYNLYSELKSPYRADAEKLIQSIYVEMQKQGKEERFNEILKENNITPK